MPFVNQRCPNCGKPISKHAEFCNGCGCPTSEGWSTCHKCGSSVGSDSTFCWKCGGEQSAEDRKAFYGDRWNRSPLEFARRVELSIPEQTFHKGVQVDEGTMALLFQNGKFQGVLEPGYHTLSNFVSRFLGMDKGSQAHAVLLDARSAEVDFMLEDIRLANEVPVDIRMRTLFKISEPEKFVESFFGDGSQTSFETMDLTRRFEAQVRQAMSSHLANKAIEEISSELTAREVVEDALVTSLKPALNEVGLDLEGVRLADFGGPAIDVVREKLGEIHQINRELEYTRQLNDAMRSEKIEAFHDESELEAMQKDLLQKYEIKDLDRGEELSKLQRAVEHSESLDNLKKEYELRRGEIEVRLEEQTLQHQSEMADVRQEIEVRRVRFSEDQGEQKQRFAVGQDQQKEQAKTDSDVAMEGIRALETVNQTKLAKKKAEQELDIDGEAARQKLELDKEKARLELHGSANMQALLATLPAEQGDRVLKLAEMEMRKGMTPEQALAFVAEKSPEIAPALAEALKAQADGNSGTQRMND
jgi:hypothetical protein